MNQPSGINVGGASFYDGLAGPLGLTHQTYLKFGTAGTIKTNGGKNNAAFDDPTINVITMIYQLEFFIIRSSIIPAKAAILPAPRWYT